MKRTFLAIAVAMLPAVGWAQEFTRYPGLSPTQQQILEPFRTPAPEPKPSPPVAMITPPAPVQSTEPQLTQFPGSNTTPIGRERPPPRGLKPAPQDRSKAAPNELTSPPADLMERPGMVTPTATTPTRPAAPSPAPHAVAPAPVAQPTPGFDNVQRAPSSTTSLPPAAPAVTVTRTQPPPQTYAPPAAAPPQVQGRPQPQPVAPPQAPARQPPQAQPAPAQPPAQTRAPAPHETPAHWQTVTLPPAPDFSRRNEPTRVISPAPSVSPAPAPAPGVANESAARMRIEADGYRQVSGLTREADGSWRGRAMRGGTEVGVRVDSRGGVSAE